MQYKPENEKMDMMNGPYIAAPRPLFLTEDHQVQRTRKVLLIILGVLLALNVAGAILSISEFGTASAMGGPGRGSQLGSAFISILFYAFGIFVAHRYSEMGLRVFAWLCVIAVVIIGVVIVLLLVAAIGGLAMLNLANDNQEKGLMVGVSVFLFVFLLVCIADFILTVIIIKFAFKLARAIDANKCLTTQQL